MEISPRGHMVWTRTINGKDFRFTRDEDVYFGTRTVTIKVEEWEPFYSVWKGEFQGTYRHTFRFSRRVVSAAR